MSKTGFHLFKIIQYGLYAVLLTPLVFWPRVLYAFMTPKFILFQVLVEIVFTAWLTLLIYRGGFARIIADLRRNYIVLALFSFFAVSFISAIFGVDFSRSFWGIGARMTGLFAELHFLAWFLILISISKSDFNNSPKSDFDMVRYLNFSFAVSILVALSAFYQNTEWRLVYGSTFFNNPTFVAPYFLFHFFWGLYQLFRSGSTKRWFLGLGTALLAFVIFLGEVRGAILGLFIGLVIFGLGLIFTDTVSRRIKVSLIAFFVAIFSLLVGLWFARESAFIQNVSTLKRLTEVSLGQTTVQTRLIVWRLAVSGFKERIWLGVGPENFNYVFNTHYSSMLLKYGFSETWFDKPHNAFLQILTETGAIGSLTYLLIWLAVISALFKLFKSGQKIVALILASAFMAYLSSMFFSFDSFGSWFGLYLLLTFLASQNRDANIQMRTSDTNNTNKKNISILFVSLVPISILALLSYVNYSIWHANIADANALRIFSHDQVQGIDYFKKSLNYFTPYKAEYRFDLIASVAGALAKNLPIPQLEDNLNFALDGAEEAIRAHPQNAAYYTDMVKLYNILGEKGRNPEILNQAEMFGKKSLELSPNRQETRFYLARTALLKGDSKLAVKWSKQAEELDPTVSLSRWYLGLALIADNQKETGKIEIKKAFELGYKSQNDTERNFIRQLGL